MRYRSRPVEIDAIQLNWRNWNDVCDFLTERGYVFGEKDSGSPFQGRFTGTASDTCGEPGPEYIEISVLTVHGEEAVIRHGDWIIPEATPGRFYPCKPDVFARRYERIAVAAGIALEDMVE